ncbi:nitroreductase family protein [Novosphingobium terrae]|uniref:nitroreductase family protein n=1 Tax=Novosphingobium terrae TaxID=2726189 RepID=UPI0019823450|nr:nitroreductase family protein [Novosphingobium terrae]
MTTSPPPPRIADHTVAQTHIDRWSPRAFDGSSISEGLLFSLFEAARWAPSAFNAQPWRFVYALRDTPDFEGLLASLLPMNQGWARHASALMYVLSDKLVTLPGQSDLIPSTTASFDTGSAWGALAHQATTLGLHTHAMAGFDRVLATQQIGNSSRYHIEAAIAVGRLGDPQSLPDMLREREFPSPRRPVSAFAFAGTLPQD